ncbi:hypothetical protein GYMLUDRAFT_38142 [Collybiopsis luxurians FD-317 M1]|nr:hypothetical protein GYMLUDRAFT_38142 [Collybiopsis luxurians FD-317 M1]
MFALKKQILLFAVGLAVVFVNATPVDVQQRGITGVAWTLDSFDAKLTAEEQKVFEPVLTGLKLDKKISSLGVSNAGIYSVSGTYKGHAGNQILVKVLKGNRKQNQGEVKALALNKQLIASGQLKDSQLGADAKPVIVMVRQPGDVIQALPEYKSASEKEKFQLSLEVIALICEEAAEEAVSKHMYHSDNHNENVVVVIKDKKVVSAKLVDYEGDRVYHVKPGVSKDEVKKYCSEMTKDFWSLQ